MTLNWISFGIVCFVLIWHFVRSIRLWRAAQMFSAYSVLLIVGMFPLFAALLNSDLNWLKWVGGVFVMLAVLWRKNPAGAALKSCEDVMLIAGNPDDEIDGSTWEERMDEFDEIQIIRKVKEERESQIEVSQAEWAEQFAASAPPRELALDVPIQVPFPADFLTTENGVKLRFNKGIVNARFSKWKEHVGDCNEKFFSFRVELVDSSNQSWRANYLKGSAELFELGFSNEGSRTEDEFTGWTEAPDWMLDAFSSSCVIGQHQTCLDWRETLTLRYGGNEYNFRTKYFGITVDLAWSEKEWCFLIRGSKLYFTGVNGIGGEWMSSDDSSNRNVWGDDCAEPVVFPIFPHELLPFERNSTSGEFDLSDYYSDPEIRFRKVDSAINLATSSSVEPVTS